MSVHDFPAATAAPSKAFVSAQQVARRAGVSRSAVSRTFTPGASVSEETRQRVLSAASELGYHVNHLARGLTRRQSGIVCVIVADIETPQIARLVRSLTRQLQEVGRVAMVLSIGRSDEDPGAALQQTLNYRAEATVVVSGTPAQSIVQTCLDNGQRLILINRDDGIPGPDNIRIENLEAARASLRAFLRAGCRRLAVVNSKLRTHSLTQREHGFVQAAREMGLEPELVVEGAVSGYESGLAAARRLFTGAERPDAIFCVNDVLALGVLDSARQEFGLHVPKDVSVIGFDNIRQADWLSYRLTTFDQPVDAIAGAVVGLVTADRDPGQDPATLSFAPTMIWRDTVRR